MESARPTAESGIRACMSSCCTRRDFLGFSCKSYVALAWAGAGLGARQAFAQEPDAGRKLGAEAWGYIEKVTDRAYATISTPFQKGGGFDGTTMSNGGIIAGKERVLVVEGFNTTKGAAWQSAQTKELAGRRPTHVVLTHFHPDHSSGLAGYQRGADAPAILATRETRRLLLEKMHKDAPVADGKKLVTTPQLHLPDTLVPDEPITVDLGGRKVRLVPRHGHTPSDITIELDDPRIVWCGDLFFNGLFPYYGDAIPSALTKTMEKLLAEKFEVYVPGHGPRADVKAIANYVAMLKHVEAAARKTIAAGTPAAEAWKTYEIPKSLGGWTKFRPDVYRFAFEAWERELSK